MEDDLDTLKITKAILEESQLSVKSATTGEEALRLLQGREIKPRLILLDIMLPSMSGWQFLEAVKSNNILEEIKIIIFSVRNLTQDYERAKVLKADGYITKPFNHEKLVEYIREKIRLTDKILV